MVSPASAPRVARDSGLARSRHATLPRALHVTPFSVVVTLACAALCAWTSWRIIDRAGALVPPLDDTFIHFQYARSFAEGHPFQYSAGNAPSAGTTSILWPLMLAPFWLLGLRGLALSWVANALGFIALGLLAAETRRVARSLTTNALGDVAGLLVLCFAPFAWFAASGMEVLPFAWLLTRSIRILAEYLENADGSPTTRTVLLHAALAPLLRPEGALVAVLAALVILFRDRGRRRLWAAAALGCLLLPGLIYWIGTGSFAATTARAKWLPFNPYYAGSTLLTGVSYNVTLFFQTLLDGREWSRGMLPVGGKVIVWAALAALGARATQRGTAGRAALVLALALGALLPTTYETFLVNRLRYLWPFFSGLLIALVVLVDVVLASAARLWERARRVRLPASYAAGFALAWALAACVPGTVADLASSADAIGRQQVSMARWARDTLPPTARVGVNDTGALAYLGDRSTFDIVGLTTVGEARYWTAGAGSRFEHYERLGAARLPTHFVVYEEWFAVPQLLGERLTERTVHATILGGDTLAAFTAEYSALGTGERAPDEREALDVLDVADLESEAAHGYVLGQARQADNRVFSHFGHVDGGRADLERAQFRFRVAPGGDIVARVVADAQGELVLHCAGQESAALFTRGWQEISWHLPETVQGEPAIVLTTRRTDIALLHVWSFPARLQR